MKNNRYKVNKTTTAEESNDLPLGAKSKSRYKLNFTSPDVDWDTKRYSNFNTEDYNYYLGNDIYMPTGNIGALDEQRAQIQPWAHKAGAGIARVGTKALTEIAKMPGVVGGLVAGTVGQVGDLISGEDNTDFIQTAFNNTWINGLNDINEQVNHELLPVHVRKAVTDGNLWDNITSVDFWATEGADGIGYIVSMLAPGAAINRFNIGAKFANINKLAKMGGKVDDAVGALGKLKISPQNANLATATMANTLFEAGAEAQGAMETYKADLDEKLHYKEITESEHKALMEKQSTVGRDVFVANALILLGPNAIMSKMLWGKPRNKGLNLKKLKTKKGWEEIGSATWKENVRESSIDAIKGIGSEGFWEEGMQSTAEQYLTEHPGEGLNFINDLPKAYVDMISETDGQKAIFLGAAFGGGMNTVQGIKSRRQEKLATNNIIKLANKGLDDFYNVYKGGNFKKDPDSNDLTDFVKKIQGFQGVSSMGELYDIAEQTGNTELIEALRGVAVVNLIKPFIINDKLGLAALKEHLEASKGMIELGESSWEGTTDSFIKHIMDTAKEAEKNYSNYKDFAPTLLEFNNESATQKDKDNFYNELADRFVNRKATQKQVKDELQKQLEAKDKLLVERGKTRSDLETNKAFAREFNQDFRVKRLNESIKKLQTQEKLATKEVNSLWNEETLNKEFNTRVSEREQLAKEEAAKKSTDETLEKIKRAKTEKEIDSINIPDGVTKDAILIAKNKKKEELKIEKELKNKDIRKENDKFDNVEKTKEQIASDNLEYVQNNYNEGEEITIDPDFGIADEFIGKDATIKSIEKDNIVLDIEGKEVTVTTESLKKVHHSNNANLTTEGGNPTVIQATKKDTKSGTANEKRGDSRILSSDNKGGVLFGNQAALDFEQSPRDKVGEEKGIELGKEAFSENQKKALQMFKDKDFSDMGFLIDHLPLNIQLSEGVTAPLETKSETSEAYNKVFNETTRHLRETIIKEIVNNGATLENIKVPIAGQWNGELQIAPKQDGKVVENPIAGLYEFSGKIEKIQSTDFYMVDDFGFLTNIDGKSFPTNRSLANAKGEMYLVINMANGKKFPLKLNVQKISKDKADVLYSLYNHIFDNVKLGKTKRISDIEDKKLIETIKTVFKEELQLFADNKRTFAKLTIGELLDLMVWDRTGNPKTKMQFHGKEFDLGGETFTKETFDTAEGKESFVDFLTNVKRQQIRFKPRKTDSDRSFHFNNRTYVNYLLNGNVLNTNAVIGKPTFAGRTSIYLDTKGVKVNGKSSKFNSDVPTYLSETLLGTTDNLKTRLPGLHSNPVALNADGTHYVSTKDKKTKYSRVSTLKDTKIDMTKLNLYNAAKRGDVVDELIRLFFSNPYMNKSGFIANGVAQTIEVNKFKPNSKIQISDKFFSELYDILESYKAEFDNKNYTIYANSPSMAGKIGNELFAGTGDLLAFNNNTKQWVLIDIKTSSLSRGEAYAGKDKYGYKKKDAIQQNAYRELFRQLNKKQGIQISKLLILPLTVKSEDPGVNSIYDTISIGTVKEGGKFLNVDMSKDVFELTKKKKENTAKKVDTSNFNTELGDLQYEPAIGLEEGGVGVDLAAFGLEVIPEKKPSKPTSTKKVTSKKELNDEQKMEAVAAIQEASESRTLVSTKYNGNNYALIPGSFYVINTDTNVIEIDINLILKVIDVINEPLPLNNRFDKKNAEKIWKSRLNVVSLPKESGTTVVKKQTTTKPIPTKKVDTMDFSKLTDSQAELIIGELMEKLPNRIMDINKVLENGKNIQEQVKELYSKLEDVSIAKNIIQTKCQS